MMNTATRTAAKKETIWSTFGITTMALMTTMLIVSTYIKIPLPFSSASITAQTLVVNLIGMLFAPLQIVAIMVSWLLLSVMGIGGSLGKLLGPAGGYRYGNAVAAILIALFCRKVKNLKAQTAFLIFVGIPVIYLFGAVQMKVVTKQPWPAIMVQAVLPFIPQANWQRRNSPTLMWGREVPFPSREDFRIRWRSLLRSTRNRSASASISMI